MVIKLGAEPLLCAFFHETEEMEAFVNVVGVLCKREKEAISQMPCVHTVDVRLPTNI